MEEVSVKFPVALCFLVVLLLDVGGSYVSAAADRVMLKCEWVLSFLFSKIIFSYA